MSSPTVASRVWGRWAGSGGEDKKRYLSYLTLQKTFSLAVKNFLATVKEQEKHVNGHVSGAQGRVQSEGSGGGVEEADGDDILTDGDPHAGDDDDRGEDSRAW